MTMGIGIRVPTAVTAGPSNVYMRMPTGRLLHCSHYLGGQGSLPCYHRRMTDGQFWAVLIIVVILAFMAGALLAVVWR